MPRQARSRDWSRVAAPVAFAGVLFLLPVARTADEKPAIRESFVTLKNEKITLKSALEDLARQTENRVEDLRPLYGQTVTNPIISLNLEQVSFWRALDTIARQADVSVYPHTNSNSVGILKGPAPALAISYSGPFRLAAKQLTGVLDLETGSRYLTASVELAWEPRLSPLLLKMTPQSIKAAGEGGSLQVVAQAGRGDVRLAGVSAIEFPIRLPLPPRPALALKQVQVEFTVLVPPEILEFRFDRLTSGPQEKTQREVTVNLSEFKATRGLWTAGLTLSYPRAALDLESHQGWAVRSDVVLERDAKPLKVNVGVETEVKEGGPIRVTYRFTDVPADPRDCVLVFRAPATPVRYPVRFSFNDLPLP